MAAHHCSVGGVVGHSNDAVPTGSAPRDIQPGRHAQRSHPGLCCAGLHAAAASASRSQPTMGPTPWVRRHRDDGHPFAPRRTIQHRRCTDDPGGGGVLRSGRESQCAVGAALRQFGGVLARWHRGQCAHRTIRDSRFCPTAPWRFARSWRSSCLVCSVPGWRLY